MFDLLEALAAPDEWAARYSITTGEIYVAPIEWLDMSGQIVVEASRTRTDWEGTGDDVLRQR